MIEDITGTGFLTPSLCHLPSHQRHPRGRLAPPCPHTARPHRPLPPASRPLASGALPWRAAFREPRPDSRELRMQGNARSTRSYMGPFASTRRT